MWRANVLQRIVASGLFQNVEIVPVGNGLRIDVVERPTINRINIEGNERLSDEALLTVVGSAPRRVYSPSQAEEDASAIVGAYVDSGRLAATVQPRIIRACG
jgi:outer membrane protein insertion porin family